MKTRTSAKTVTFRYPFALAGLDEVLPAGTFSVEIGEMLIEGVPYLGYRRLSTLLRPLARADHGQLARALIIDPDELEAALRRDQLTAEAPASGANPRQQDFDLRAIDRAEDEGMISERRQIAERFLS